MKCPMDDSPLQIAERHGIEIDYCPDCRGVWLDRGELDKIIDRADAPAPVRPVRQPQGDGRERHRDDRRPRHDDDDHDERFAPSGKRRRSSFLGDLFDLG